MSYSMSDLLQLVVSEGASDLHIRVGTPPTIRVHGILHRVEGPSLTPEDTEELMRSITSEDHIQHVRERGGADFGFAFGDAGALPRQRVQGEGQFRHGAAPDSQQAADAGADRHAALGQGTALQAARSGPGHRADRFRQDDHAGLDDQHHQRGARRGHIITIEDPIEYYHKHKKALVTQREIGVDVPNFAEALRRALRQDPDVILVGEMRDLETIEAAITAAETGHLVFGTLHTTGAAKTIDRIVNAFPTNQQERSASSFRPCCRR